MELGLYGALKIPFHLFQITWKYEYRSGWLHIRGITNIDIFRSFTDLIHFASAWLYLGLPILPDNFSRNFWVLQDTHWAYHPIFGWFARWFAQSWEIGYGSTGGVSIPETLVKFLNLFRVNVPFQYPPKMSETRSFLTFPGGIKTKQ